MLMTALLTSPTASVAAPVDAALFRLPRERWEVTAHIHVEVEGFDGCERLFGLDACPALERSL